MSTKWTSLHAMDDMIQRCTQKPVNIYQPLEGAADMLLD